MKNTAKPFGLQFLQDMPEEQRQALLRANGGRHHHKKKPPIYHTMMASFPGPNGTTIGDQ